MTKAKPYFGVELDAKKKMPRCARAAGVEVGTIAWGLLELWEHVWLTKETTVSPIVIEGCFGASPKLIEALVANGFLEVMAVGYRVKGAVEKLLGIREAQSAAGKANAANLKQNQRPADPVLEPMGEPVGSTPAYPVTHDVTPPAHPTGSPSGSRPALSPTTHHPPPSTYDVRPAEPAEPAEPVKAPLLIRPVPADKFADAESFWAWAQSKRVEVGLVTERFPSQPRALSAWWSEVGMHLNGDYSPLEEAWFRFGEEKHWQESTPPAPFAGFMSQWERFVRREVA